MPVPRLDHAKLRRFGFEHKLPPQRPSVHVDAPEPVPCFHDAPDVEPGEQDRVGLDDEGRVGRGSSVEDPRQGRVQARVPEREESTMSRGRQVDVEAPRAHHPHDHSPLQEEGFRGRLTIEACLVREGKSENPPACLAVEKYIHASWLEFLHDHGPGRECVKYVLY